MGNRKRWVAALCFVVTLSSGALVAVAQTDTSGSAQTDAYRAQLQAQLDSLEKQIAAQQAILEQAKTQDVSLSRDIKILDAQIKQAQLEIKARTIAMTQLQTGITQKQQTINTLNTKLGDEMESLAALLREKNRLDTTSPAVAILSAQSLSDFFIDLDTFDQINEKLQDSFSKITDTKNLTQEQQNNLQSQLDEETKLRQVQQLQKDQIAQQQSQKQKILAETKGQEKAYQALITKSQQSAAQIRAALFQLNGSAAISFGKALDYANEASKATGIRPAFLLGIIREESNLGSNVGKGTYTTDMHPTHDVPIFMAITSSLGLDPTSLPVSKKQWYGWGGAMGPAQFIPSTWAGYAGYVKPDYHYDASKDRVGKLTGNQPPNPWNPEDAFMASAIYLTDSGAAAQTPAAEFKAAMCYLAGCGNVNKADLQFYGQQVAQYAAQYQCQIDIINGKGGNCSL